MYRNSRAYKYHVRIERMKKKHASRVIITKSERCRRIKSQQSLEFYIKRFFAYRCIIVGYRSTFGPCNMQCTTSKPAHISFFLILLLLLWKQDFLSLLCFICMWILLLTFHVTVRCIFFSLLYVHCVCAVCVVSIVQFFFCRYRNKNRRTSRRRWLIE